MSHTRTKPADWGMNQELSYAEITDIDRKTAESVDKTTAGDEIAGEIAFVSGAALVLESGSTMTMDDGSIAYLSGVATVTGAGAKISTLNDGRIEHGDDDYPELKTGHIGRSMTRKYTFAALPRAGAVTAALTTDTIAAAGASAYVLPVHHGATLSSVEVRFVPTTPHVGLPATNLAIVVQRRTHFPRRITKQPGGVSYTPVSHPDYDDGLIKQVTLTCDQNNVINRAAYVYELIIQGEGSTNSLPVFFLEVLLHFTSILDLRPA